MEYQELKSEFEINIDTTEVELIKVLENAININSVKKVSYRKVAFSVLKDLKPLLALQMIEPAIHLIDDAKFLAITKKRALKILKLGNEEVRPIYKKILLKELELQFINNIEDYGLDLALVELDFQISKYPYLAITLCRRLRKKYADSHDRLHGVLSTKLSVLIE
ncbi:hypothetical protein CXF72_01810 [Psychromonas sp. MB-3u-54]|uniref:hypothetical protein n=1 Tax=Psychromonas sp. MB-3u-54 TaxID=2058319 RepID=UPI000C3322B7|nr:hypothetical protein [Psychromonas sp. MB-3u-54]PKH04234.1 hypothetical protein CXF72_01810 [Psychromonas sp. MB-3u-54]